jgi:DNA-binding transcriptional MerR regulator
MHTGSFARLPRHGMACLDRVNKPDPEFSIGELAKEFGITLRALRFYENRGLMAPRRAGSTRFYSRADRDRLALILNGKKLGFTLTEIAALVADRSERHGRALKLSQEKCLKQIARLEQQRAEIEAGLVELRKIAASL